MTRKRETRFARLLSLTIVVFSIIFVPLYVFIDALIYFLLFLDFVFFTFI